MQIRSAWAIVAVAIGAMMIVVATVADAGATVISYTFAVVATTGPLTGQSAEGTFSFDDSIAPAGGGSVHATGLLSDLHFIWNGVAYDESTANTGALTFSADGDLTHAFFGNNCVPGACSLLANIEGWIASPTGLFDYRIAGGGGTVFGGSAILTPEPTSLLLLGTGVAGLFAQVRRRRR